MGPGAWATGLTACLTCVIFVLALRQGEARITLLDWISLLGAISAGLCWFVANSLNLTVAFVTLIELFAFVPTLRKSVSAPHDETLSNFTVGALKHMLSIAAISTVSFATVLYPLVLGLFNGIEAVLLIVRRRKVPVSI